MRRLRALALCAILFFVFSCEAEALSPVSCACGREDCVCFLKEGDGGPAVRGVILCLKEAGFLGESHVISRFDGEVTLAVRAFQLRNGLPLTGTLDDATLTLLLWGLTPEEMNRAFPDSNPNPVWIPTDGGIRRHKKPECSGMYDPRMVSVRNAEALGFDPCGRCKPE